MYLSIEFNQNAKSKTLICAHFVRLAHSKYNLISFKLLLVCLKLIVNDKG